MAEEQYNLDELVAPGFMDEAYIVKILRQVEDDPDLHVINYEIRPGSAAGDHYASVMFKIIATYGSRGKIVNDRRLIFKTVPEAEGQKKELLEHLPAFKNEILVYTTVLPEMDKILKEHGETGWWPKLVYSQEKPFVLMFDDLTVENYEVLLDRLNFDDLKMIVEKIAKYHALSMVMIERGQEELKDFKIVFPPEMKSMFEPMTKIVERLAKCVQKWSGYEDIGTKLEKFVPKLSNLVFDYFNYRNDKEFNVLTHGDFHMRNLMFKRNNEGSFSDVIFLDFQVPNYNLPSRDLIGMLTTMCTEEVKKREADVIKLYHKYLVADLKKYGYVADPPSLIDIQVTLLRMSTQEAFYTLMFAPNLRLRGFELGAAFNPTEEVFVAMEEVYEEPNFKEDLKLALKKFDSRGIFDQY